MDPRSASTSGRTLDHAAWVYDFFQPLVLLGRESRCERHVVSLLAPRDGDRILDLGCGTGVLTRMIADRLDPKTGGKAVGIDAAAKMIAVAQKKRASEACHFETMAAERLSFDDASFDGVVSSLFFHHVNLDLKAGSLAEAYRVLRPGGRLIVADMHVPTTLFGAIVSHAARWFLMQPEIGENTRGVLPDLMQKAGFARPEIAATYFGYLALFVTHKPETTDTEHA